MACYMFAVLGGTNANQRKQHKQILVQTEARKVKVWLEVIKITITTTITTTTTIIKQQSSIYRRNCCVQKFVVIGLVGWLVGRSVGWLVGWLVGCLP